MNAVSFHPVDAILNEVSTPFEYCSRIKFVHFQAAFQQKLVAVGQGEFLLYLGFLLSHSQLYRSALHLR